MEGSCSWVIHANEQMYEQTTNVPIVPPGQSLQDSQPPSADSIETA